MSFTNLISVKKSIGFGYKDLNKYLARTDRKITQISFEENLTVQFYCDFDFGMYPFDKHKCNLTFYEALRYPQPYKLNLTEVGILGPDKRYSETINGNSTLEVSILYTVLYCSYD